MNAQPRPWIAAAKPYIPGVPARVDAGRLASNESPFGPSQAACDAMIEAIGRLNRYPDPLAGELRSLLADAHGVDPGQVLVGNGSDEIIYLLVMAFAAAGGSVVCADPPYGLHSGVSAWMGASVHKVPLVNWRHDLAAMSRVDADLAFVCNPHNPTGTTVSAAELENFVDVSAARLVIVDEAYADFVQDPGATTAIRLAAQERLVSLRTFSKLFGLAGVRIGYMVGPKEVVQVLQGIRPPFSVNAIAQAGAAAALGDSSYAKTVRDRTISLRSRLIEVFEEAGYRTVPSQANFVLVLAPDEGSLVERLNEKGVSVRPGRTLGMPGAVRVTVPSAEGLALLEGALADRETGTSTT
jgi:histidinol-phosphate aminotransferase